MRKSRIAGPAIALAGIAAVLSAYLLPGEYILEKVSVHTQSVRGIYVKQKVISYLPRVKGTEESPPAGEVRKEQNTDKLGLPDQGVPPDGMSAEALIGGVPGEKEYCQWIRDSELFIEAPDRLRLRIFGKAELEPPDCPCTPPLTEDQELLQAGANAIIIKKNSVEPLPDRRKWFFADFLIAMKTDKLKKEMQYFGVSLESVRLSLLGEKVAYLLGEDGKGNAYVWLDKDSFLPLRISFSGPEAQALRVHLVDYQYLGNEGVWYPARIDFFEGELRTETYEMNSAVVNPRFPAGTFDEKKIQEALQKSSP
jgi:hypothetical protein